MTQKTDEAPQSLDQTILQYLRERDADAVPDPVEDVPTAPIRFGVDFGQPPELPATDLSPATVTLVTDQDELMTVTEVDDLDLSDFEDEEPTKVPTGD